MNIERSYYDGRRGVSIPVVHDLKYWIEIMFQGNGIEKKIDKVVKLVTLLTVAGCEAGKITAFDLADILDETNGNDHRFIEADS